jgi:hypothetical protein
VEFLSNGDFLFPLDWLTFWIKHFFIWSFQNGALNPDGIIRLPGRLGYIAVFMVFGNIVFEYVYIISTLLIAFGSFWYFSRTVLGMRQRWVIALVSLLFAINPIFLGNISKVGLVLAAAILPLCMAFLYKFMRQQRFWPLVALIICLNIGLLHPFNFTVNLVILGLFFICLYKGSRSFLRRHRIKIGIIVALGIALNAYFLVPMANIGTLDKSALADNVQSESTDYSKLVDIANTNDLLTGFGLAKNVLKDYEFYDTTYQPLYFVGAFLIYIIIFGLYTLTVKKYALAHKRWFIASLTALLALILLAAVNFFYIDVILKALINLPAGWMFRSPLKWQLYIPLFLGILLVLSLSYMKFLKYRRVLLAGLGVVFVMLNGFLIAEVSIKLLTPQKITTFAPLLDGRLHNKTLLYVAGGDCFDYSRDNPAVLTELNQVLTSENVQVKRVAQRDFKTVNVGAYSYVLSCKNAAEPQLLTEKFRFTQNSAYKEGNFILFKNSYDIPYASSAPTVTVVDDQADIASKYDFMARNFPQVLPIITKDESHYGPALGIQDIFDDLSPAAFQQGALQHTIRPLYGTSQRLVVRDGQGLYYSKINNTVNISTTRKGGMTALESDKAYQEISLPAGQQVKLSYDDPSFSYDNVIPNASFEEGPWQKEVGDCYAYDKQPVIGMDLNRTQKTDGQQSLRLWAKRHNACSGTSSLTIEPGQYYLLSFSYKSSDNASAGYSVNFNNDHLNDYSERLENKAGEWGTFTQVFKAPENAKTAEVRFYAFPDRENNRERSALYDSAHLVKVPDVQSRIFLLSGDAQLNQGPSVTIKEVNPTKKVLTVQRAVQPFYLTTTESYHSQWQLHASKNVLPLVAQSTQQQKHLRINTNMNGWYIDPTEFCKIDPAACKKAADGSYTMTVTMEFLPQRWFYTGLYMSTISFVLLLLYAVRLHRQGL